MSSIVWATEVVKRASAG